MENILKNTPPNQESKQLPDAAHKKKLMWAKAAWLVDRAFASALIGYGSSSFAIGLGVFLALTHLVNLIGTEYVNKD